MDFIGFEFLFIYCTARFAESLTASAGVQRPPTPTVDFIAALFAAFSAVQSGSSNPPPLPEVEQAGSIAAAARQMTNINFISFS